MRFPRNARILHSQLDAAPVVSVFFLLVLFVLLGTLVYTPGVQIDLPNVEGAGGLVGVEGPTVAVAVDAGGQFYFENQGISPADLKAHLTRIARKTPDAITLIVLADKSVKEETVLRLGLLASEAGIHTMSLAALPP